VWHGAEVEPLRLPESLAWMRRDPAGAAWLATLPALVDACAARWGLVVGQPFAGSYAGMALPATNLDGEGVVLKLQRPDEESAHEAAALQAWDGQGAVRLLDHDVEHHALLLERCRPGHSLRELAPDDALDVLAGLLPRLWVPAGAPFRSLADEAARWQEQLPLQWDRAGRPFERALVDAALDALDALAPTQGEQVLLHQDLHADNVLAARREPWLVIDPKPLVGERAFGLAPIVRSYELGHSEAAVRHRLDRLCDALLVDRDRARGWALGQTLAWAFEHDAALPRHVETARWLLAR
jgi:streptomycin 6-kinase